MKRFMIVTRRVNAQNAIASPSNGVMKKVRQLKSLSLTLTAINPDVNMRRNHWHCHRYFQWGMLRAVASVSSGAAYNYRPDGFRRIVWHGELV